MVDHPASNHAALGPGVNLQEKQEKRDGLEVPLRGEHPASRKRLGRTLDCVMMVDGRLTLLNACKG